MFQIASLKIICTDSTEIFFSNLRAAGFNYHLPKQSFFTDLLTDNTYRTNRQMDRGDHNVPWLSFNKALGLILQSMLS